VKVEQGKKTVFALYAASHNSEPEARRWSLLATLFALLVVICIPLVLLLPLAFPIGDDSVDAEIRNDFAQLSIALDHFKIKFGIFPPSRIKLCSRWEEYGKDRLDQLSLEYLLNMFPKLAARKHAIAWAGANGPLPKEGVILEGDQCLVFFLGGIPEKDDAGQVRPNGFGVNRLNPAAARVGGQIGPFYQFDAARLIQRGGSPFFSYLDPYGEQPYAYLSTTGRTNGYNPLQTSDCLSLGVWPYAKVLQPEPEYWAPDSFQIICAGADRQFGPGSVLPDGKTWTPETAHQFPPRGQDDLSNFHERRLGSR
jgi:hypothetical protein